MNKSIYYTEGTKKILIDLFKNIQFSLDWFLSKQGYERGKCNEKVCTKEGLLFVFSLINKIEKASICILIITIIDLRLHRCAHNGKYFEL